MYYGVLHEEKDMRFVFCVTIQL